MPTLWEILTAPEEEETPVEFQFYNPLKVRVGNAAEIDTIDLKDQKFTFTATREIDRGDGNKIADYDLLARGYGEQKETRQRIRLVPMAEPDGKLTHHVILLNLLDEFGYDKPFHDGLLDTDTSKGEFMEREQSPEGEIEVLYYRVNDILTPWEANTAFLSDKDHDGEVEEHEVQHGELTYWDFWCDREVGGVQVREFLIVEMDENGWFMIWRGQQIDPERILVS